MGINRRSVFLHVFFSCSDVNVGDVRESNESWALSGRISGYVDDFSILAVADERGTEE